MVYAYWTGFSKPFFTIDYSSSSRTSDIFATTMRLDHRIYLPFMPYALDRLSLYPRHSLRLPNAIKYLCYLPLLVLKVPLCTQINLSPNKVPLRYLLSTLTTSLPAYYLPYLMYYYYKSLFSSNYLYSLTICILNF